MYAEKLVSLLRLNFSFSGTAPAPIKNPDMLLIASLVLAVKLLYPLHGEKQYSISTYHRPSLGGLRLDWKRWAEVYERQKHQTEPRRDFEKSTSAEVYDMTGEDMDRYLDWYQETQITAEQGMSRITFQTYKEQQLTCGRCPRHRAPLPSYSAVCPST